MPAHLFRPLFVFTSVAVMLIAADVRAQSQRSVVTRNLFWGSVVHTHKFNARWALVSDGLFRVETTDGDLFQSGIRSGIQYKTARGIQWTAGGCVFLHYPNPNGRTARPELRGWQEAGKRFEFGFHHTFFPRIRFEQRFIKEYTGNELSAQYDFHSFRLRLRVEYFYSLGTPGAQRWSVVAGDEFMFHRRGNGFTSMDQNRAWAGFAYRLSPVFTAQLTYLHIFQQRSHILFDQFHVIRLTLQINTKKRAQIDESQK